MLIIKGATPQVAQMRAVRAGLTRIDVDRDTNRYDIYFDAPRGISFDEVTIYNNKYLNVRVMGKKEVITSFQIGFDSFAKAVVI